MTTLPSSLVQTVARFYSRLIQRSCFLLSDPLVLLVVVLAALGEGLVLLARLG